MRPADLALLLALGVAGCGEPEPRNRVLLWRICLGETENAISRRFQLECIKANTIRNTQTFSPEDIISTCRGAAAATCPQHLMVGPVGNSPDWGTYVPCGPNLNPELTDLCTKAGWRP